MGYYELTGYNVLQFPFLIASYFSSELEEINIVTVWGHHSVVMNVTVR